MDPKATLQALRDAIDDGDYASAVQTLINYYQWRLRGGFEPDGGDSLADLLGNRLCDAMERAEERARARALPQCECPPERASPDGPHPECPDEAFECATCGNAILAVADEDDDTDPS